MGLALRCCDVERSAGCRWVDDGLSVAEPQTLPTTVLTGFLGSGKTTLDRKSTRLNSSHLVISYAVFCLKKKNIILALDDIVIGGLHVKDVCIETPRLPLLFAAGLCLFVHGVEFLAWHVTYSRADEVIL